MYCTGRRFVWCTLVDCVSAGWSYLQEATDINNKGTIIGYGDINGNTHAFIITAVPIPLTLHLFGSGIPGMIGIFKRMWLDKCTLLIAPSSIAALANVEGVKIFEATARLLRDEPETVNLRIEDRGPRKGMWSVTQLQ